MQIPHRIGSFLLLAFGSSWAIAGLGALLGVNAASGTSYTIMAGLCMLGPAFAAIVQHRFIDKACWHQLELSPNHIRWRWLAQTAVIGLCIFPLCLLVLYVFGDVLGVTAFGHVAVTGERFSTFVTNLLDQLGKAPSTAGIADPLSRLPGGLILAILLGSALIAACTVDLPFMLGEELGWRGYLYRATSGWNPLHRVLFTGCVWGLWHAPLIVMGHNYPGYPFIGIGMMVVFCVLLAFLFDHSRFRVNSVWGPCVLHGLINSTASTTVIFAWDGHILFGSGVGLAGFLTIFLILCAVLVFDRGYRRMLFPPR